MGDRSNTANVVKSRAVGRDRDHIGRAKVSSRFDLVGPIRAAPHPPTPRRRPDHKSLQAEATTVEPRQRELPGVSFCDGQNDFPQLSGFCWSVCRVSHTARIIELQGGNGRNHRHHYQLSPWMLPSRRFGAVGRANMIISQTPNRRGAKARGTT